MTSNPTTPNPTKDRKEIQMEDQRNGYQVTAQLITYEGQLAWAAVSAFVPLLILLLAGSVLETLPFMTSKRGIIAVNPLAAVVGVAACLVWLAASARSRRIHKYWLARAREFEKTLWKVDTLTRGQRLTAGQSVEAGDEIHKLRVFENLSHTKCFAILYVFCAALFVIISVIQLLRLGNQIGLP